MEQQVGTEVSRRRRQEKLGIVIRDKMTKTVVVEVRRLVMDPLYHKYLRRRSLSRHKRWVVKEVVERASAD